jgi:hypothetical protein
MLFAWIRSRRRARLARRPFPPEWMPYLDRRVPFLARLDGPERARFLEYVKVFVWEKQFSGVQGMEITDEVRVVIAAAAARLILNLDLSYYDRLAEIVVYPGHYKWPDGEGPIYGEVHDWGTVILSWPAVVDGLKYPGEDANTAIHEFAHVLDHANGGFDGTPVLHDPSHYKPWARVMSRHFLRLRDGKRIEAEVLDEYGAKSEAEFFAVATEAFFDRPAELRRRLPALYRELKRFYRIDPPSEEDPDPRPRSSETPSSSPSGSSRGRPSGRGSPRR